MIQNQICTTVTHALSHETFNLSLSFLLVTLHIGEVKEQSLKPGPKVPLYF